MNAFFSVRKSAEVELHYNVPYDWEPPTEAFARLKCKRSEGRYTSGRWSCGGLSKDEVQIASRESIGACPWLTPSEVYPTATDWWASPAGLPSSQTFRARSEDPPSLCASARNWRASDFAFSKHLIVSDPDLYVAFGRGFWA